MRDGDYFLKLGKQDKSSRQERKREKRRWQEPRLVNWWLRMGLEYRRGKLVRRSASKALPAAGRLPLGRRLGQVSGWLAHSRAEEPPPGSSARPQPRRRGRRKRPRTWPAPRLGGGGAQGSPDPPGDQAAGRHPAPSLASKGKRSKTDGPGGEGLGQGEEGAAWRARAQAACTRRKRGARGAPGRGGDGGGVGAALSQAVAGAASLLPF